MATPTSSPDLASKAADIFGRIAFNPPSVMTQYMPETVEVRIARNPAAQIAGSMEGAGSVQSTTLKVGEVMKVSLRGEKGDEFEVTRLKPPADEDGTESIGPGATDYGDWVFSVVPKVPGDEQLFLDAEIRINKSPAKFDKSLHATIHVTVNRQHDWQEMGRWILNNWAQLTTIIVIPLGAWLFVHLFRRRRAKKTRR